ncbi:hypothetical protein [Aureimonas sp. AU12]|uniref:hypothetical protein n=1 Tax=Aureimonas sp. AU12 TaxID=1638161 RepID=UPI0012E3D173|nr:hypothetical protein [Aureimonas sp. AU12]
MKYFVAGLIGACLASSSVSAQAQFEDFLKLKQSAEQTAKVANVAGSIARQLNDLVEYNEMCNRSDHFKNFIDGPLVSGNANRATCCQPELRIKQVASCIGTFISPLPSLRGVKISRRTEILYDEAKGIIEGDLQDQFFAECTSNNDHIQSCLLMDKRSQ